MSTATPEGPRRPENILEVIAKDPILLKEDVREIKERSLRSFREITTTVALSQIYMTVGAQTLKAMRDEYRHSVHPRDQAFSTLTKADQNLSILSYAAITFGAGAISLREAVDRKRGTFDINYFHTLYNNAIVGTGTISLKGNNVTRGKLVNEDNHEVFSPRQWETVKNAQENGYLFNFSLDPVWNALPSSLTNTFHQIDQVSRDSQSDGVLAVRQTLSPFFNTSLHSIQAGEIPDFFRNAFPDGFD